MQISLEEKIVKDINKQILTKEESLELIDDLYWADWDMINDKYKDSIPKIFNYLKKTKTKRKTFKYYSYG